MDKLESKKRRFPSSDCVISDVEFLVGDDWFWQALNNNILKIAQAKNIFLEALYILLFYHFLNTIA